MVYKSKMQTRIGLLCVLSNNGRMDLIDLSNKLELGKTAILQHLLILMNQGYVKKRKLEGNKNVYYVTERGRTILKVIGPIVKEAHKIQMRNLEAIETVLAEAGY